MAIIHKHANWTIETKTGRSGRTVYAVCSYLPKRKVHMETLARTEANAFLNGKLSQKGKKAA